MNPAIASLMALLAAIVISMISRINVGIVAIALAWIVGVFLAGFKTDAIISGFSITLFLTLTGVTLLFSCAEVNGTLELIANRAISAVRGKTRLLPLLFFLIAFLLSTVGPGAISSVALVIPPAMAIGQRAGLSRFLIALMVANGANAGNLSPISAVGVIANTKMAEAGLGGHEWKVWFANFASHAIVALAAYKLFGKIASPHANDSGDGERIEISPAHKLTLIVILAWIVGVLVFKFQPGLSAFVAAALIIGLNGADEAAAIRKIPWGVIVMVCGVSLLVSLVEKTGGMDQFTSLLARTASPRTINGIIAFITGAISTYSSTSGVVLPAFLPTAPKLVEQIGGGDALAVALSINVGSSIVDVSPLSTLGALCTATVSDPSESKILFKQLLFWGLSMTIVGSVLCWLFAGLIAGA